MGSGASTDRDPGDGVGGEAARSAGRLAAARDLLADLLPAEKPVGGSARVGVDRIDDDDELRALLRPAETRIARLADLAGSLAAGTLSDEDAADAARAVADAQPHRRPR